MGGAGYLIGLLLATGFIVWVVMKFGSVQIGQPPDHPPDPREPGDERPNPRNAEPRRADGQPAVDEIEEPR